MAEKKKTTPPKTTKKPPKTSPLRKEERIQTAEGWKRSIKPRKK
jgi:hypothetical protein